MAPLLAWSKWCNISIRMSRSSTTLWISTNISKYRGVSTVEPDLRNFIWLCFNKDTEFNLYISTNTSCSIMDYQYFIVLGNKNKSYPEENYDFSIIQILLLSQNDISKSHLLEFRNIILALGQSCCIFESPACWCCFFVHPLLPLLTKLGLNL